MGIFTVSVSEEKRMKTVAAVVIDKMAPLDLWGPIQAFQVAFAANPDEPSRPDSSEPLYKVITLGKAKGPVATGSGAGPRLPVFWYHSFFRNSNNPRIGRP